MSYIGFKQKSWENCSTAALILAWLILLYLCVPRDLVLDHPRLPLVFLSCYFPVWQDSFQRTTWFISLFLTLILPSNTFLFSTFVIPLICSSLLLPFLLYCESWLVCGSQLLAVVLHNWPCVCEICLWSTAAPSLWAVLYMYTSKMCGAADFNLFSAL